MDYIEKLTALRVDNDLSQKEIAKVLKTTQASISKYELGQRKYQVQDIITLCKYYGVSSDYLFDLPVGLYDPRKEK